MEFLLAHHDDAVWAAVEPKSFVLLREGEVIGVGEWEYFECVLVGKHFVDVGGGVVDVPYVFELGVFGGRRDGELPRVRVLEGVDEAQLLVDVLDLGDVSEGEVHSLDSLLEKKHSIVGEHELSLLLALLPLQEAIDQQEEHFSADSHHVKPILLNLDLQARHIGLRLFLFDGVARWRLLFNDLQGDLLWGGFCFVFGCLHDELGSHFRIF